MDLKFKKETSIFLEDDNGFRYAEILILQDDEDTYEITHTKVDPSYQGMGIAKELVKAAVDFILNERKGKIKATCSYAKHYLEKNNIPHI